MSSSNPPRRKPPAFKPPRPINAPAQSAASATRTVAPAGRPGKNTQATSAGMTKEKPTGRAAPKPATKPVAISSSEEDNGDGNSMSDEEDLIDDTRGVGRTATGQEEAKPAVPQKLLARLIHDNFEDQDMKIGKEAMAVIGEYMKTFVREAMARANHELHESDAVLSDGFLQVEHLEKIAPQLLLDF